MKKNFNTFLKILKIIVKSDYTQYDQYNIDSNKGADTSFKFIGNLLQ